MNRKTEVEAMDRMAPVESRTAPEKVIYRAECQRAKRGCHGPYDSHITEQNVYIPVVSMSRALAELGAVIAAREEKPGITYHSIKISRTTLKKDDITILE